MLSRIRRYLNTHKIINVLIFSYAIMLILPFIAGMISFSIGNNIIKDYVASTASSYAKSFSDKFDGIILDYSHVQNQLYFDEEFKELCININNSDDVFSMRNLSSKLKSLIYSNSNISEIAVFPYNSDYMIHSNGFFEKEQYYNSYFTFTDRSKEKFDELINYHGDSCFNIFPDSNTFAYSVNLPVTNGNSPARIFILSDCTRIFRNILPKTDAFFVYQGNNLLIGSNKPENENMSALINQMSDKGTSSQINESLFLTSINSEVSNLTYYYATDLHSLAASQKTYNILCSVIFLITLLISIVLFKLFIEIQYKPITTIIKYIKSHIKTNNDVYSFEFINNNINNLEKEILHQKESFLDQNNLLVSMQLSQWLKYNKIPQNTKNIFELKKDEFFVVISAKFSSQDSLFYEYNPQGVERNISIAKFIIENTLSEMLDNINAKNKMIEFDDSVVSIIVFDRGSDYRELLKNTFEYITQTVQKEFNLEPSFYCSLAYDSYDMLHNAYNETLALTHNKKHNENFYLFYEDANLATITSASQLTEASNLLFKHITVGNSQNVESLINNICTFTDSNVSISYMRYTLSRILSIINDALYEASSINEESIHSFIQQHAPIDMIMNDENLNKAKESLIAYGKNACEFINDNEEKPASISQKAKLFIDQHYSDSQLTSELVATNVGLSRDYFLKLFKQQTGESMSDYLNKIRIESACEIIKSEKCSLSDVASRVGYTNVKTFTRAFIKHIGITPGKYNL